MAVTTICGNTWKDLISSNHILFEYFPFILIIPFCFQWEVISSEKQCNIEHMNVWRPVCANEGIEIVSVNGWVSDAAIDVCGLRTQWQRYHITKRLTTYWNLEVCKENILHDYCKWALAVGDNIRCLWRNNGGVNARKLIKPLNDFWRIV